MLAFAAVYLIWGSTYLAIRLAVATVPPFLMLGFRFTVAGLITYAWLLLCGTPRPTGREWLGSAVTGGLLFLGGAGSVAWSEQILPSGLAALIVAIVPVWMTLLDWLRPGGDRPGPLVFAGLVLGLAGMTILVGPVNLGVGEAPYLLPSVVVVGGTLCWAGGAVFGTRLPTPHSPFLAGALQMVAGGALLLVAGTASGEWSGFEIGAVSVRSALAVAYLIVFGSLAGFLAFVYLLRVTTPARVGSYAYVNPVVAVFLGWAVAGEPVTLRTLLAAAIILTGVVLIVSRWRE